MMTKLQEEKFDIEYYKEKYYDLDNRIKQAVMYIDKLLYFGIRNEEIDLTEIKLYLIQKDYCDITKRNIRNYKKEKANDIRNNNSNNNRGNS